MSYPIQDIEGIGPKYGQQLAAVSIKTTNDLLKRCADAPGRKAIAAASGLTPHQLLEWANRADLMRISGIGPQYSDLLEASGVDTVKELRTRRPDNLAAKMKEINAQKRLTRNTPAESLVMRWVESAKQMDPKITH